MESWAACNTWVQYLDCHLVPFGVAQGRGKHPPPEALNSLNPGEVSHFPGVTHLPFVLGYSLSDVL